MWRWAGGRCKETQTGVPRHTEHEPLTLADVSTLFLAVVAVSLCVVMTLTWFLVRRRQPRDSNDQAS